MLISFLASTDILNTKPLFRAMLAHSKPSDSDLSVSTVSTTTSEFSELDLEHDDDIESAISSLDSNLYQGTCAIHRGSERSTVSCLTIDSSRTTCTRSSSVSFGLVEVREYERIAGDHPETTYGVPLGIGWAFKDKIPVSVDKLSKRRRHQARRHTKGVPSSTASIASSRSTSRCTRLGAMARKNLLHKEHDVPLLEIREAEKALEKYKKKIEALKEHGGVSIEEKKSTGLRKLRKGLLKRCGFASVPHLSVTTTARTSSI